MRPYVGSSSLIYLSLMTTVMTISPTNKKILIMDSTGDDIADYMSSKGYLPNENVLPTPSLIKNIDNDATYLLSKLSDEELLKLLDEQPLKDEYNLKDIVQVAFGDSPGSVNRLQSYVGPTHKKNHFNRLQDALVDKPRLQKITDNDETSSAFFRLENKHVDSTPGKNDPNYLALQKLRNLLYGYKQTSLDDEDSNEQRELMFDILVGQLKTLCCKKSKTTKKYNYKTIVNELFPSTLKKKIKIGNHTPSLKNAKPNEYMFLIINDDIKSNGSEELMAVDPESLDGNSSVLLLGPVKTPLADNQLKLVMARISDELAKPEYLSLLHQLSDGVLIENNKNIMKNFIFGPETRRYIKPHRCNHQSKLARIYGGPKWIICTGYLNLNKPSLYD